jgi:hypothetical protein
MASNEELKRIVGQAVSDAAFRQALLDDPVAAIQGKGVELTTEQVEYLRGLDRSEIEEGLGQLDERLSMGCWGHWCLWD